MRLRRASAIVALVILTTAVLISLSGCATRLLVISHFDEILRYNGARAPSTSGMVRFQNDEDEPFGVFGARLAKGQPSYTQDESPVGNT